MNQGGPIVNIEDDLDDHLILKRLFKELNYSNEVIFFADGEEALKDKEGHEINMTLT